MNFGKEQIQICKVLSRKILESESVVDRGNSSPHAAAAAVGSFRSVLLLNSLREQQLKKAKQSFYYVQPPSRQKLDFAADWFIRLFQSFIILQAILLRPPNFGSTKKT